MCSSDLRDLKKKCAHASGIENEQSKAEYYSDEIKKYMISIREVSDELEDLMDDSIWTLPKYWEMLFIS